jgi:outer membrane protein assembly factor BamB
MAILQNKIAAFAIATFFALSMIVSIPTVSNANAHDPPWQIPTHAFINVAPNPAGVGQEVTIGFWISLVPPTASGNYGDRWINMMVKVTSPDGDTKDVGSFTSDATGGTFTTYTPTKLGNYTFTFSFPGQTLLGANPPPFYFPGVTDFIGDYYEPSNATTTLTVQQEPIPIIPENPLPTAYWTRPINAENNNWYSIAGNWLGLRPATGAANTGGYNVTGNYNPYTTAPTTGHILWTKPIAFGGTVGGEFGGSQQSNYYSTRQYETMFAPIIINGILYYTEYPGSQTYPAGWAAVDLRTGQTLWTKDTTEGKPTILRCGQILEYYNLNQYGSLAYLWSTGTPDFISNMAVPAGTLGLHITGTTYNMFDAMTGNYILSIVNGTSMHLTIDESGNLIGYYINNTNRIAPTLVKWNSTQCMPSSARTGSWRPPQGAILPFENGIMWSKPIATNISDVPLPAPLALPWYGAGINSGVILMVAQSSAGVGQGYTAGWQIEAAYSDTTGEQLWITNRTVTPYMRLAGLTGNPAFGLSNGVYVEVDTIKASVAGYSAFTGEQLWTAQLSNFNPYDSIGSFFGIPANGVLYLWGLGGDVYAINMKNGTILWETTTTQVLGSAGSNTPYGVWPLWTWDSAAIAGGLLYIGVGHEYSPPLFRGAQLIALNTTNGQLVWSQLGFDVNACPAIADGIMINLNAYDNQIYAYGKGPTKVTVTAPDSAYPLGTPIVIKGTVTDISAGSQQQAVAANSPNGLPCISDESMSDWMEYVYMQQPLPTNATGVEVIVSVLDPNNNCYEVGKATSNTDGTFGLMFDPPVPGKYTIFATFEGSESYYSSYATTYLYMTDAPVATPAPTPSPAPMTDMYVLGTGITAIIAIIIIGLVIILMLRKH